MAEKNQSKQKLFNSSEEVVSMVLGLVIVLVIVGLIFNFFQKRKGSVSVPGITTADTNIKIDGDTKTNSVTVEKKNEMKTLVVEGEYLVKRGDNLWAIASSRLGSGYNWVKIAKLNNLANPGVLVIGQKLSLPKVEGVTTVAKATAPKVEIKDGLYQTVRGDNLWKIATSVYGDGYRWVELWKANKGLVPNPDRLAVGIKLSVPNQGK